jgi:hypothetical protein
MDDQTRVALDTPVALLELLYGRAALGLDVLRELPEPVAAVPEHHCPPEGASARWVLLWNREVTHFVSQEHSTSRWLSTSDAEGLDAAAARAWVREQRSLTLESALMVNATNGPRVHQRALTLAGKVTGVAVLPVLGHCWIRPKPHTLIVSLATFRDETSWTTALRADHL